MTAPQANDAPITDNPAQSGAAPRKIFVVLNPVAGLTTAESARQVITNFCQERQWVCEIYETQKDEVITQEVKDRLSKGVDIVIAAGGDGTISDVVAGMIDSQTPMAILPAGTGNNLARDLGIPLDLASALTLLDGNCVENKMDVMQVNQAKYYVLNVSVGVSSLTIRKTLRQEKRRFGLFAYIYRAAGSIRDASLHRFRVRVDNRMVRFTATELMVANSKFMGYQPNIEGLVVDPNDGRMDIFIIRAKTIGEYLGLFLKFVVPQKNPVDPKLHHLEARSYVRIESEFPLPVQADGEEIGNTPVEVRLLPSAIRILVPAPAQPTS